MLSDSDLHELNLRIREEFGNLSRPMRVSTSDDPEREQIERRFGSLTCDRLTPDEARMMILDGDRIAAEAFWYFLPRLAKAVFFEGADAFMFGLALKSLDKSRLSQTQRETISKLESVARQIDDGLGPA